MSGDGVRVRCDRGAVKITGLTAHYANRLVCVAVPRLARHAPVNARALSRGLVTWLCASGVEVVSNGNS